MSAASALAAHGARPRISEEDISKDFKANGSTDVDDDAYRALAANGFADWKLKVDGLVGQPLRAQPRRASRHAGAYAAHAA